MSRWAHGDAANCQMICENEVDESDTGKQSIYRCGCSLFIEQRLDILLPSFNWLSKKNQKPNYILILINNLI